MSFLFIVAFLTSGSTTKIYAFKNSELRQKQATIAVTQKPEIILQGKVVSFFPITPD